MSHHTSWFAQAGWPRVAGVAAVTTAVVRAGAREPASPVTAGGADWPAKLTWTEVAMLTPPSSADISMKMIQPLPPSGCVKATCPLKGPWMVTPHR
jgi:hypothetical protein